MEKIQQISEWKTSKYEETVQLKEKQEQERIRAMEEQERIRREFKLKTETEKYQVNQWKKQINAKKVSENQLKRKKMIEEMEKLRLELKVQNNISMS